MQKKSIILIVEILTIIVLSILVGSVGGGSLFSGDINPIDEGQFGSWANHMLLGKQMYKDIYITYGPLFIYPLYILFKLFGPSFFLVRGYILIGSIIGILISLLIMYTLRILPVIRYAILVIMIFLPVLQLRQAIGLLSIFLLMHATDTKQKQWFLFTGVATTCSFLISPDIGLFVIFIEVLAFIWYLLSVDKKMQYLSSALLVFIGLLITFLLFCMWANAEGWLGSYVSVTRDLLFTFSGINLPNGMGFPNLLATMPHSLNSLLWIKFILSKVALLYWGILFYIMVFLYVVIITLGNGSIIKVKNMLFLSLLGFFFYTILIGRWGIGHFFFILAPILMLLGYFVTKLLYVRKKDRKSRIVAYVLLAVIGVFALRLPLINRPQIIANFSSLSRGASSEQYIERIGPIAISESQRMHYMYIDEFIENNTKSNQSIFFISNEPVFYMLTNRTNPTRFDLPYIVLTKAKRYETLADLQSSPPQYIFDNTKEWHVDGISNRQRMPEVSSFVKQNYRIYKKSNGIIVYKYKNS